MKHDVRFTIEKISKYLTMIEPLVYRRRQALQPFRYFEHSGPMDTPLVEPDADDSNWQIIEPGTYWGKWKTDFTMRGHFQLPQEWSNQGPVALYLPVGKAIDFCHPEALVYIDGEPFAARDSYHQEIQLPSKYRDGRKHLLALHGWTGNWGYFDNPPPSQLLMGSCEMVQIDQPTRDFVATVRVTLETAKILDKNCPAKGLLLNALDEAFKILDTREPFGRGFYASVTQAHAVLREGIAKAGPALNVNITAIGHSHIDVAWKWTLDQSRRKCGRSFHTVIRLMEQFGDYDFTQSQPQLYDFVRNDYPELFGTIKQRVAEGRWEPIGGMWVEADCNISGPESLVRQFLLGRSFFTEHFGHEAESPVLWLPDVFGYAYSLPQLIKQAGLKYFYTTKIFWNQYNRLPFESFWWQGLDGTKILTHFGSTPEPEDARLKLLCTYNGLATAEDILKTWTNFQQKELQQELMTAFGYGDGGGGPTRQMLENIRELADFPAMPRVKHGKAIDFFRKLEAKSADKLPVWNGELYLELHRGTYTTQSRNKRANRKCEFQLHDAELLASLAGLLDADYKYPHEELRKAWKLVCLNQFHDILPGTGVGEVYTESLQQYDQVRRISANVRESTLSVIAQKLKADLLLINPTSFVRDDLAFWPGKLASNQSLQRPDGMAVYTQVNEAGTWIAAGRLPCLSATPLIIKRVTATRVKTSLAVSPRHLENDLLRAELNENGDITRIYDKKNRREVLSPGGIGNQFQAFEDRPLKWDACDIEIFFEDKMWTSEPAESVKVVEAGPLRATLEVRRRILNSEYTQLISLNYNSARLDFETTINWRQKHILLKAAFPVDILARQATYEIQWGNIQRPTHRNTSWDWARFELCAQKWADLSEGNYGVSLLNDCKYGYDIKDNLMRISLLRSPTMPDPQTDQGKHQFTYSLLPHTGKWGTPTITAAYALNDPLIVYKPKATVKKNTTDLTTTGLKHGSSMLEVDSENIVIETVKQAEDANGIIVRLYESMCHRGPVTLTANFELAQCHQTNLLEQNTNSIEVDNNRITLFVRPYEIVNLRLVPAQTKSD